MQMETVLANMGRFGPNGPGHGLFWPLGGLLMWMVLFGLLAAGMVMLLRRRDGAAGATSGRGPTEPAAQAAGTPLEVAKMRYARGELTKEEFEALKADLE
jgi:putative membrane protein